MFICIIINTLFSLTASFLDLAHIYQENNLNLQTVHNFAVK